MPRIDPEVFDIYFEKRNFTYLSLAEKTGIDESHIRRMRREEHGGTQSVEKLAGAFGIDVEYLINGIAPPIAPKAIVTQRYPAVIVIDVPRKVMLDAATKNEKIASLQKFVGCAAPIDVKAVNEGSAILEVTMTSSDILRLLAAMMDNQLDVLKIKSVSVPNPAWMTFISAILHLDKGVFDPLKLDPEAASALLDSRLLQRKLLLQSEVCALCRTLGYEPVGTT